MRFTDEGIKLLTNYEGFATTAYPDPGSPLAKELLKPEANRKKGWEKLDGKPWTISVGLTGPNIVQGTTWTEERAWAGFYERLHTVEDSVRNLLIKNKISLTDSEFSAIVCFVWNVGVEAFQTSTLLKDLAKGAFEPAITEFPRWNKSHGEVMNGLIKRRAAEQALFRSGMGA